MMMKDLTMIEYNQAEIEEVESYNNNNNNDDNDGSITRL